MEILKIEYVKVFSKSIISAPEARYLSLTILMRETETTRKRKQFRESLHRLRRLDHLGRRLLYMEAKEEDNMETESEKSDSRRASSPQRTAAVRSLCVRARGGGGGEHVSLCAARDCWCILSRLFLIALVLAETPTKEKAVS